MERFLTIRDVLARIGVSRSTLWRWEQNGDFPRRIALSSRKVVWREVEVTEWQEKQIQARDKAA